MKILMRYKLINGETIEQPGCELPSIDEARDMCARMFTQPGSVASLHGADGSCRVVHAAYIAHIELVPESVGKSA